MAARVAAEASSPVAIRPGRGFRSTGGPNSGSIAPFGRGAAAMTRAARPPPPPPHLSNVQILRGVAAVMVLVYHIGNEFTDRGFEVAFPDVSAGSAGVDLFFVVSGFIVVYSTGGAFGRPGAPGLFLARRLARIVPLYWLVTTLAALAAVWRAQDAGLTAETWRWFAASYAFLFYPHGRDGDFPLYAQGWTLNFEMFFYACFALALALRRAAALAALTMGLIGLTALGLLVALPWPVDRWADTNIVEFLLGVWLAAVHARGVRLPLGAALALAAAGFATIALTVDSIDAWLPYRGLVWGPPALAVVAAAALHVPRRGGPLRSALETLGDASYALYLVHPAFFVGLGAALGVFASVPSLPAPLYGALCFFGSIAVSLAVHRVVEAPVTRGLNHVLGLPRRWAALTSRPPAGG